MENEEKQVQPESVSIDDANAAPEQQPTPETNNPQIDELTTQIATLNDKYLRAVAELENTRRRAALDAESRARARAMWVAEKILPVMDAIVAAQQHAPDDAGIKSLGRAMESALTQIGITKIESVGQILNPQLHNAIQVTEPPADATPRPAPNTILTELQTGYMFDETVLRPAMVIVCR